MSALYELKSITKEFDSGSVKFKALRGINLKINQGEVVALVGPSGSGKSTLLNVLGLIEEPTSGSIAFAGKDLTTANESLLTRVRRGAVGFVFQNFNLIPILSALENVEYALYLDDSLSKEEIRKRSITVLKALGMTKFMNNKPAELSGGQRQRVAIARAIVKKPHVVVADEPTANLDSKTADQIMKVIRDLNKAWGTTVIIATHDAELAKSCDKIVQVKDGKVASIK
jgi:putative ABC transport system ATP-binding protein